MDINKLIEALNNPNSAEAQQLLEYLTMSPLDPAAAMQQLMQGAQQPQGQQQPGLGAALSPETAQPMQMPQAQPGVTGQGPWSGNYTAPNNAAPMTDPNNPVFVPPAAAQATGMAPNAQLMPGEFNGLPEAGGGSMDLLRTLEGLGGLAGGDQGYRPMQAPGSSPVNTWRGFEAGQFQLPQAGRIPSLAELLRGV